MVVQNPLILLVLFLTAYHPVYAASAAPVHANGPRPAIAVWDTCQPSAQALAASDLATQKGWTKATLDTAPTSFQGDAVVSNGRIMLVVRAHASAAEVYALDSGRPISRLRLQLLAPDGEPADYLECVSLVENTKTAACLEVVYKTARGSGISARLRIKRGEVSVQADPGPGADRLRVESPGRFAVLPDFFADDILIDARAIPLGKIELPSENFLLHLTANGDAVATCVFENRKQDVVVALAGAGDQRTIAASEIPFEGKRVWVALLEGPGVWHARDVKTNDISRIRPLAWSMPFPARWRVDFTRSNDLTDSWDLLLEQSDGSYLKPGLLGAGAERLDRLRTRWSTVLGAYGYPCWADQEGRGYLLPLGSGPLEFRGPAVIYPLNRVPETPLDAYTVVDIMRNTLGVGPCEHILDVEGQKAEYKGKGTCIVREELTDIYCTEQQKQKRAEVEKLLDDGLIFVKHIRGRIDRYIEFARKLRQYLAEQKKAHPELSDFLDEMDKITQEIDARVAERADKIQTPAHVVKMNEEFRKNILDHEGPLAQVHCLDYCQALVEIGGSQDELVGHCRWVVKSLRQRAGIRLALDPQVSSIAAEIRARTQEALRNPAKYEGPRH